VCVWLRTPVGWKTELVLGNCERSTCVWKLPDCKNESLCPKNVEAGRVHVWRLSDCKNVSSCWKITRRGPVEGVLCGISLSVDARVFGE
jgi:hypothetical protein